LNTERIERKGQILFGYSQYIQEVSKQKLSTEKVKVETFIPVEMSYEITGQKVNIIV
jgi:hypothetical protein